MCSPRGLGNVLESSVLAPHWGARVSTGFNLALPSAAAGLGAQRNLARSGLAGGTDMGCWAGRDDLATSHPYTETGRVWGLLSLPPGSGQGSVATRRGPGCRHHLPVGKEEVPRVAGSPFDLQPLQPPAIPAGAGGGSPTRQESGWPGRAQGRPWGWVTGEARCHLKCVTPVQRVPLSQPQFQVKRKQNVKCD